jgi:hypothetical protein
MSCVHDWRSIWEGEFMSIGTVKLYFYCTKCLVIKTALIKKGKVYHEQLSRVEGRK